MSNLIIILISVFGGCIAFYVSHNLGKGPVYGSAIVTLLSGVIFMLLEHFGVSGSAELAIVATTASYAGMASKKYVMNIWQMAVVGVIAGTLYVLSTNLFVGIGGRLGTIAAVSCFAFIGLKKIIYAKFPRLMKTEDISL